MSAALTFAEPPVQARPAFPAFDLDFRQMILYLLTLYCTSQVVYFTVHYLFASQTAHVGALYSAFLAMNLAAGVPPLLAVLALGYSTNLFGALTHYSSGQAAVYFGGKDS